jgi:hypothetical protein
MGSEEDEKGRKGEKEKIRTFSLLGKRSFRERNTPLANQSKEYNYHQGTKITKFH